MEDDKPKTPASVRLTEGILMLSTVFFTAGCAYSFAYESSKPAQYMYATLLVVLPVFALTGLFTQATWGRRAATLALLCMWAFQLKTLWVFSTMEYAPLPSLIGLNYFTAFMLMLAGFAIGVPLLLFKLYRGQPESRFFAAEDLMSPYLPSLVPSFADSRLLTADFVPIPDFDQRLLRRDSDLFFEQEVR